MTSATQALSGFSPAIESGRRMFSSAVSIGSRLKNWKTKPMCLRRSFVSWLSPSVVISVPSMETVPEVGRSRPARMCMRVDLPEPEGPITAVSWPRPMSSETPRSASTATSPEPYRRCRAVASTTACGARSATTPSAVAAIEAAVISFLLGGRSRCVHGGFRRHRDRLVLRDDLLRHRGRRRRYPRGVPSRACTASSGWRGLMRSTCSPSRSRSRPSSRSGARRCRGRRRR